VLELATTGRIATGEEKAELRSEIIER